MTKPLCLIFRFLAIAFILLGASCRLADRHSGARHTSSTLKQENFENPPLEARPSALWTWMNAHVDRDQLTHELEEMKDKGMRGAIIWDMGALIDPEKLIPEGPAYLGPESLENIHHAIKEAGRLGLEMGISGASSWNSGGPWIEPELGCQTLAWTSTEVSGPKALNLKLPLPEETRNPTRRLAVIAIPSGQGPIETDQAYRLDGNVDADGILAWDMPEGDWEIIHFVSTHTGQGLMCPSPNSHGPMIDHLSAEATRKHIGHVLKTITEDGEDLGALKTLFLDSYEVKTPIDWTPVFSTAFQEAYAYDPLPWLPVLAGKTVVNEDLSQRFRHDYGKLVSDLAIENHYALANDIANEHGLQLLAEAGHGGYARFDTLKALGAVDIPMGEFWNHRKNWCTKEAASAANLYGKKFVNAESMTGWQHWQDGPQAYKRLTDIAFCAGLNQITFHTFAHQPPGSGLPGYAYHAGEHFNVNLTWWPQARPLLDALSRSSYLLQQGTFVADVVAYYGDGAPNLVPARRLTPTIEPRWTDDKCLHCGTPKPVDLSTLGQSHDYDYLNQEILIEQMEVRDGKLVLPSGMEYRLLVLPKSRSISLASLKKIEQLVREGATVTGAKPLRSNSMAHYPDCDLQVRTLADKLWGDCDGNRVKSHRYGKGQIFWNVPLNEVLARIGVVPDFTVEGIDNSGRKIDYIHRSTGKQEIYFICNTSDDALRFQAGFRVGEGYVPSFWNAEDGRVSPCYEYKQKDGRTYLPLDLAPAESVFVVFTQQKAKEHFVTIDRPLGAELKVLNLSHESATAHVWQAGSYAFRTSHGRNGRWEVETDPQVQTIDGPWQLRFPLNRGAPDAVKLPQLVDWTRHPEAGVKYFSGTATYEKSFDLAQTPDDGTPLILDLGKVKEVAVVRVNGKEAGTLWKEPYRIDIAELVRGGQNKLEVKVTNVWNNRLVGDTRSAGKKKITKTNISRLFEPDSPLLPSGLMGPVTLSAPVLVDAVWE
ncbi:hypothetical protein DDZ13_07590 [Coraliomargarita sinensis]|uniref:Beta-mannosidase-like galactose-binding domain-containing protein n=1 Tax=Coraliomargarita sinensis TaxID=2174842 RepID=A0A317ZFU1_9BACT|nr:glycosyl hydrolase [Coraliomargarita sinensis]PXA04386.1 hypothetical protein DDZ13_07590 [Coraliomargarita sinensis]